MRKRTLRPVVDLNQPRALSVPETAAILGISEQSVSRLVARGEIKSMKIGKSRRVPSWEVLAYMRRKSGGDAA